MSSGESTIASGPVQPARTVSGWGIAALIVGLISVVPQLLVLIIAQLPQMEAAPWLFIVLMPAGAFVGLLGSILGVIGLARAPRENTGRVLPAVGLAISAIVPVIVIVFMASTGFFSA